MLPYEILWALTILVWVAVLGAMRIVAVTLRRRHRVRFRELLHRERLAAIEKGIPLPEIPLEENQPPDVPWRTRALQTGIILLALGLGICASFYFSPNDDLRQAWSLGLIAAALGLSTIAASRV